METNGKATSGYLNLPLRSLKEVMADRSTDDAGTGMGPTRTSPSEQSGGAPKGDAEDLDPC